MTESKWQDSVTPELRQLQIIVGALVAGCVFFLVIAVVLAGEKAGEVGGDAGKPVITYVAIVFVVMVLVMRMVVPGIVVSAGRRKMLEEIGPPNAESPERTEEARALARLFATRTIIAGALLEGAAFFLLVSYLVEQQPLSLIVAVVLISRLVFDIPTRARIVHWIEDQLLVADQERQLGR
jgi:hypothetical protein